MKKGITAILYAICTVVFSQNIELLHQEEGLSFRGLSALNDSVVWVSGNKGTVLRTEDGGKTFQNVSPKGYEKYDFRDIEAINDSTAIIMGIASPGILLLTNDKGKSWKNFYQDERPNVFMDAMHLTYLEKIPYSSSLNDESSSFYRNFLFNITIIGDPIKDNKAYKVKLEKSSSISKDFLIGSVGFEVSRDEGKSVPKLNEGEAFFAASGTNIASRYNSELFFVSGGLKSRLFVSFLDDNEYWEYGLPMLQGKESTGANSITFDEESKLGMIVGGDFLEPDLIEGNSTIFKVVQDSIEFIKPKRPPNGYRSCVDFIGKGALSNNGFDEVNGLISCGLNGVDLSIDDGEDWFSISKESYHVCLKARDTNMVFLAGRDGKIGKFEPKKFNLWETIEKNKKDR